MQLNLLELLEDESITDPLLVVLKRLDEKSNYGSELNRLSFPERVIYLVGEIESEVNSGGLSSYHFNSSGHHAKEGLEALKIIKSKYVYKLFKKSINIYGIGPTNDGRYGDKEREDLTERQENKLDKLDSKFYEYKENIYQLQTDYIKENVQQFNL